MEGYTAADMLHEVMNKTLIDVQKIPKENAASIVNESFHDNMTLLHFAALTDCKDNVKILIELGANVNALNYRKDTPLHYAEGPEVVDILIENGAIIDCKNNNGQTLLDLAIMSENMILLHHLLKKESTDLAYVAKRFQINLNKSVLNKSSTINTIMRAALLQKADNDACSARYDTDDDF